MTRYYSRFVPVVLLVLNGCTSVPSDMGRSDVSALLSDRGLKVDTANEELVNTLIATPLSLNSAVRVALINNPQLQSTYATLGFGAADLYEAGRIRNPVFMGSFLDSNVAGEKDQITLGLVTSFTDIITLPARKRLSIGAFQALKEAVGAEVLVVAGEAEKAYYEYMGAQQIAALRAQIAKAGTLSAELAGRFRDAGNLTARELAMERAAASAARLSVIQAQVAVVKTRTRLAEILGLSIGDNWQIPASLGLPVDSETGLDALIALARKSRLDLASARTRADVLADQLGVVGRTRWLGELDIGFERERETDGAKLKGPTVDWEIPVFNQHRDAMIRASTDLQIAVNDVRRISVNVENSVRLAYAELEHARARVDEYRNVLIPQRTEIVSRAQEEVNFMLIGVFELIALKQDEYDTYQGYLETIVDYWIARADLGLAVGAELPGGIRNQSQPVSVEKLLTPAPAAMDHSGHMGMNQSQMTRDGDQSTEKQHDHGESK